MNNRGSRSARKTWILLKHEAQLNGFEAMEVINRGGGGHNTRYSIQRQEGFTSKIIAGDDVMIH
ncbi:hypothetical protein E2C01_001448 [Portunus trituberculatus]|uniref:Uncharacterized protein n=1 Tax=Portunus trituberculatus TaxID=210409 RepID=A0A5B7CJF8_PORTR|nr:hypothetical protein [Portunus trituberculatus]